MKLVNLILVFVLLLAAGLRLYKLDTHPVSAYGDEISFAWNAWSVLKTGADEYGIRLPLQFKAFDDYKAPIPVYLLVPMFAAFGMNMWSLRVPVAIAGTLTVWVTYLLVRELLKVNKLPLNYNPKLKSVKIEQNLFWLPIISALLLAISPWHIHLSRGYFEATLALLSFILGIYFYLKGLTQSQFFYASAVSFALSLYTYFTPRLLLLIFLPFLYVYFRKHMDKDSYKQFILAAVLFGVISLPLVKLAIFDNGGNRLTWFLKQRLLTASDQATRELATAGGPLIIKRLLHNRYSIVASKIGNDYLEHFSFNFWYIYGDNSLRYFLGNMGMFYLAEMPFLLIGLYMLLRYQPRLAGFIIGWLLLAPIPTALVGRSFAVRSIAMLPAPFMIVGYGILSLIDYVKSKYPRQLKLSLLVIVGLFIFSLSNYVLRYHLDYIRYAATWWGWENKAAIDYARAREADYDQIFLSDFYSGMPLALAFYTQADPWVYRQALDHRLTVADGKHVMRLGKYYIGSLDLDEARLKAKFIPPKTLYIARPEEADSPETINAPDDGRLIFKVYHTE